MRSMSSSRSLATAGAAIRACAAPTVTTRAASTRPAASPSFARSVFGMAPVPSASLRAAASAYPSSRLWSMTLVSSDMDASGRGGRVGVLRTGGCCGMPHIVPRRDQCLRTAPPSCRTGPFGAPSGTRACGSATGAVHHRRPLVEQGLRGRVVGPSAHRCVTASAGSGSTITQRPSVSTTRTPSVVSTNRSPAASTTRRITSPLTAHGSGQVALEHVRPRNPRVDLAERQLGPRHQPEQPDEGRRCRPHC
jgi:hypothetical protein